MGDGRFIYSASAARSAFRSESGTDAFEYSSKVKSHEVEAKIHDSLNFSIKKIRESRDNETHPNSYPIASVLDVTGSMSTFPKLIIDKLNKFMEMVLEEGIVANPQILHACCGDVTSDRFGIQVGEFEGSDELAEQHLSNMILEGGGGPYGCESYEMFFFIFARYVHTDAFEKRGEKGLLFFICDESPYPYVKKNLVKDWLDIDIQSDIPTTDIVKELLEKWDVFCIRPGEVINDSGKSKEAKETWESLLPPQHVIKAEKWSEIVPKMSAIAALHSGMSMDETIDAMKKVGYDISDIDATTKDLAKLELNTLPVVTDSDDALDKVGASTVHGEKL